MSIDKVDEQVSENEQIGVRNHFVDAHPAPYDGATTLILFFPLVLLLVAFTYGILKIPSLVNSLFTGRSGESALWRF